MQISSVNDVLSSLQQTTGTKSTSSSGGFSDIFSEALLNATETDTVAQTENENLLTGETDSIHTPVIAAQKAELALSLAVQVRNKVIEAYHEIMNMQV